ncbi:heme-degrading domain-containing protein [Agrobacterium vitis]|uniref:Heme-degrading domain-containing protein n=1 Tax=Agrobacterium vitis TaxID=373 RepID=A0A6L6VM10_AGRVI|nr:heme-degrading domain-containing protein [Agrobacterium vitis]MUZ75918.1 heme-degrading domain-containing protein [Agrobacterium vitis]
MTASSPTIAELEAQEEALVFSSFGEAVASEIGLLLLKKARDAAAPVVINIRTPNRTLFHAALPGSAPDNDHWARRKSNVVLRKHHSSMLVGGRLKSAGDSVGPAVGLDPLEFAAHGGSFPIRVANCGVFGAITVSGMASEDDHRMIVDALQEFFQHPNTAQ